MAYVKTVQKLKDVLGEIEGLEPKRDCEAYIRGELLEHLYKANELLEYLAADALATEQELPRKHKKKGSV